MMLKVIQKRHSMVSSGSLKTFQPEQGQVIGLRSILSIGNTSRLQLYTNSLEYMAYRLSIFLSILARNMKIQQQYGMHIMVP